MWLLRGAQLGEPLAMYNLGGLYNDGVGIEKDREQAQYWYNKSLESGYDNEDGIRWLVSKNYISSNDAKKYLSA